MLLLTGCVLLRAVVDCRLRAMIITRSRTQSLHAPPQAVPPAQAGIKIKSVKISPRSGTGATKWYWPPKATGGSKERDPV